MRWLAYLVTAGLMLAGPAVAEERADAIEAIALARAPECALPVALLSVSDAARCRRNLETARMIYVLQKSEREKAARQTGH